MTDWKAVAVARNLDIPPEDLAKIIPGLDALEEGFLPLLDQLSYTDPE